MSILSCKSLREVEQLLASKFEGISIISEVPVAKSELMNVERMFKQLFVGANRQQQLYIQNIWRQYPLSSLIVTVYIGIYYYNGNYWANFTSKTGCTNDQTWKECFMGEIERRRMFVFDRFGSMKYVSTILGHAGVPQNSFEGFANGFIKPAFESGMNAADALQELVDEDDTQGSDIRMNMMHKGVRDYLRTGGKVAEDFVARCLQLVPADLTVLDDYQHILPRRILKLFQDWHKKKENQSGRSSNKQLRIKAPEMKLDPYLGCVYLQLSIQQVKDYNHTSALWRIRTIGGAETVLSCGVVHLRTINEFQLISSQEKLEINPGNVFEVQYEINGVCQRKWRFNTTTQLVFERNSLRLVRSGSITASNQWIVLPKEMNLASDQQELATFEPMRDSWRGYLLWEIDASVRTVLKFSDGNRNIDIAVEAELERAFLKNETKGFTRHGFSEASFYDWPLLCIPSASFPDFRSVPDNWRLQIIHNHSQWKSERSLHELIGKIKLVGSHYEIPLSLLSPEQNAGVFSVNLLAGLGSDIHLSFIKLPSSMRVDSIGSPIFPLPNGIYPDQSFCISVEKPYVLTCVGPSNVEFTLHQSRSEDTLQYQIKAPRQVAQVSLQLFDPLSEETCELKLVTKALSWHLINGHQILNRNEPIRINEQYLTERFGQLRIVVDSSSMQSMSDMKSFEISLCLTDHSGRSLLEKQRMLRPGHHFVVDTEWFEETILSYDVPFCRLWLDIPHLMARPFVLMEVNKQWTVSQISAEMIGVDVLHLKWSENYPAAGRVIRIWDEWHPWNEYKEYEIPDGTYEMNILNWDVRERGDYLFEWYVSVESGLFSFLQETRYPGDVENSWRWHFPLSDATSNPLAELLLGEQVNGEHPVFGLMEFQQMLDGIGAYGENYIAMLVQTRLVQWRTFARRHRSQVIEWLADTRMSQSDKETNWLAVLVGLEEWTVADMESLMMIEVENWRKVRELTPLPNAFGFTRSSISLLIDKPAEDINQMRQLIPPGIGVLESYNVPNLILSFMLACKNEPKFAHQLNQLIRKNRVLLIELAGKWKGQQPQLSPILSLIETRWEPLDEPIYINYPYYIAITAAGLRLHSRQEQSGAVLACLRDMSMAIRRLTPGWLEHDLLFMESVLLISEKEKAI